jgi:hypothetical protein
MVPERSTVMGFQEGEIVRVESDAALRRGETAVVRSVLPLTPADPIPAYLVEFDHPPRMLHGAHERFRLCIYREDELLREEQAG